MRSQHRLLTQLVRARPEEAARLLEAQPGTVDWPTLLEAARAHAVTALLQRALTGPAAAFAPEDVRAQLRHRVALELGLGVRFGRELFRVLELLREAGIAAIPLKGPTLAVSVYGSLALRPFDDLDVLVRPRQAAAAMDVLTAAGYRPLKVFSWESHLVHDDLGLYLDLHQALSHEQVPLDLDFARLEANLGRTTLLGREVPTLGREDLLLLLCAHLVKDCYGLRVGITGPLRLVKAVDVAELLAGWEPDWAGLLRRARAHRAERLLLMGLALVEGLFGLPLPAAVRAGFDANPLRHSLPGSPASYFFEAGPGPFSEHDKIRFQLRVRERMRDRLGLILRPTELDRAVLPLPRGLRFLHYLTRPLRVGVQYGRELLHGRRDSPDSG